MICYLGNERPDIVGDLQLQRSGLCYSNAFVGVSSLTTQVESDFK